MTENIEDSFIGSTPEPWLRGVTDQYEEPSVSSWKVSMSFGAAGKLLSGLFKGSFRGIEVLTRGVSPRIVSVNVLGSGGSSTDHRARTRVAPRPPELVGLFQRQERQEGHTRARPQLPFDREDDTRAHTEARADAGDPDGGTCGIRAFRRSLEGRRDRRLERRVSARTPPPTVVHSPGGWGAEHWCASCPVPILLP